MPKIRQVDCLRNIIKSSVVPIPNEYYDRNKTFSTIRTQFTPDFSAPTMVCKTRHICNLKMAPQDKTTFSPNTTHLLGQNNPTRECFEKCAAYQKLNLYVCGNCIEHFFFVVVKKMRSDLETLPIPQFCHCI
jgi:hypothetical protein